MRARHVSRTCYALAASLLLLAACGRDGGQDRFESTGGPTVATGSADALPQPTCRAGELSLSGELDSTRVSVKLEHDGGVYTAPATEGGMGSVRWPLKGGKGELLLGFDGALDQGPATRQVRVRATLRLFGAMKLEVGNCQSSPDAASMLTLTRAGIEEGNVVLEKLKVLQGDGCVGGELTGRLLGCFGR